MSIEIKRNSYGQPLIIPPGGGKPVAYARASSFGGVLEDKTNLEKYLRRMAIKGLTIKPDLHLAASVTPLTEKRKLNDIVEKAIEAAGGGVKASTGTSLHTLTEMLDAGVELPPYPAEYRADLLAYAKSTEMFDNIAIERFVVNDELRVAGTPDRVARNVVSLTFGDKILNPAARICDLKTGGHPDYLGQHAVQLAIYSRSENYDPATGERSPLGDVSQEWGVIYHSPSGEGRCDLVAMDLSAGWDGALLAADVRQWRKRKGLAVRADVPQAKAA